MTLHKRKKVEKYRGSKTHGGGAMKKRRGAGNRGGRGRASTGKRGDAKKPSIWGYKNYFAKTGFTSKSRAPKINPLDIRYMEDNINTFVKQGIVKLEKDIYKVNLSDLGFNKLLSTGKPTKKFDITVDFASKKAIEKIQQTGGKINVRFAEKQKKQVKKLKQYN